MRQRKKKNTNKPSVSNNEENKTQVKKLEKQTNGTGTGSGTESNSSSSSSSKTSGTRHRKNNITTSSNEHVKQSETSIDVEHNLEVEENSSSFAIATETAADPTQNHSLSPSVRKLSELKTIRIPLHSEQKPPLPPPHNNNNNYHQSRTVEKSRSLHVKMEDSTDWKNRSQRAVFRSSSLKALVQIPSTKEIERFRKEREQLENMGMIMPILIPLNSSIRQILTDFANYRKINETNGIAYPSPLMRTLKQGGMGGNSAVANQDETVHIKKYKKVPPTLTNTKKLVAQVLRDLITLYKTEQNEQKRGTAASQPKVDSKPIPRQQGERKPVEIKIRKVDDKIIIKSNEPVVINTTPDIKQVSSSQLPPPLPLPQPPKNPPKTSGILRNEFKLKTSVSADNCVFPPAVAKTNSTDSLSTVLVQGPNGVKRVRYLGVFDADPVEYARRYKNELCPTSQLPEIVKLVKTPPNIKLAAETRRACELEGDLEAFKYVNLEKGKCIIIKNKDT